MGLHNGIENIDHPVIATADLDATRQQFERLGFTVPPRGSHIEWGTGNLCIMFPDDYIEVRGILDTEKFTMHLDTHLEKHGEGLMHVVVIQHLTPELIRRPDFLSHANGCVGINKLSGTIVDVGSCATKMRQVSFQ